MNLENMPGRICTNCLNFCSIIEFYAIQNNQIYSNNNCKKCLFIQNKQKSEQQLINSFASKMAGAMRAELKKVNPYHISDIFSYLSYTAEDLKLHIESKFETWMSWNNNGKYITNFWNDNDSSTWKWQIDHIIPKSIFTFKSIVDDSFQQCWSLSNLRPLNAKQNQLDGVRRTRH